MFPSLNIGIRVAARIPHKEKMAAKYRIHFADKYGPATIECKTESEYNEIYGNVIADNSCEDIWTEYYDEEEGWQT